MNVTGSVWLDLTKDERMVCLEFASWENRKRMKKAIKAPTP